MQERERKSLNFYIKILRQIGDWLLTHVQTFNFKSTHRYLKNWKKDDANIFAKREGKMCSSKNFPINKMWKTLDRLEPV